MRVHTSLTWHQIYDLVADIPNVYVTVTEHGSRIRARGLEIRLEGTGGMTNSGRYGAGDTQGATWDEWGVVFGRIYTADPSAVCGGSAARPVYADSDHFTWSTGGRFSSGMMPADTHPRHKWERSGDSVTGSYSVSECRKCSAISRHLPYGVSAADSVVFA